jgi:hypothetical protein
MGDKNLSHCIATMKSDLNAQQAVLGGRGQYAQQKLEG